MMQASRAIVFALCTAMFLLCRMAMAASLAQPEEAGMRLVAEHLYVDPEMPADQAEKIQPLLESARRRVATVYGELLAQPNIVFCASDDCYRAFGAIGLGFTDGTNLVISPQGQRVAILAHELAHVELSKRIGGLARVLERIPQWFDEGQAVMVSRAEEFSDTAWKAATDDGLQAPPLRVLASLEEWNRLTGANGENMQFTYGTARREVDRWFSKTGPTGFQALLSALQDNEPFAEAYARLEAIDN